jgi:hypothetical protein
VAEYIRKDIFSPWYDDISSICYPTEGYIYSENIKPSI